MEELTCHSGGCRYDGEPGDFFEVACFCIPRSQLCRTRGRKETALAALGGQGGLICVRAACGFGGLWVAIGPASQRQRFEAEGRGKSGRGRKRGLEGSTWKGANGGWRLREGAKGIVSVKSGR